jgi:hypothetical protein
VAGRSDAGCGRVRVSPRADAQGEHVSEISGRRFHDVRSEVALVAIACAICGSEPAFCRKRKARHFDATLWQIAGVGKTSRIPIEGPCVSRQFANLRERNCR